MSIVVALIVGFCATRCVWLFATPILSHPTLARTNYRGIEVPTGAGLFAVLGFLMVAGARSVLTTLNIGDGSTPEVFVVCIVGFALLGLCDDLLGDASAKGFRGHITALIRGRLTTGGVKLVGGVLLALYLVGPSDNFFDLLRDAALVCTAANLANLLDLAPGRAIKVGLIAYIPLAIVAGSSTVGVALALMVGGVACLLSGDLRERFMLGDTGSNALGAVLGLGVVYSCSPGARVAILAVLVAANVLSEFVSFSTIIAKVLPLRILDQLGRVKTT